MTHQILKAVLAAGGVAGWLGPGPAAADPASDLQLAARFSPVLIMSTDLADASIKVLSDAI